MWKQEDVEGLSRSLCRPGWGSAPVKRWWLVHACVVDTRGFHHAWDCCGTEPASTGPPHALFFFYNPVLATVMQNPAATSTAAVLRVYTHTHAAQHYAFGVVTGMVPQRAAQRCFCWSHGVLG